MADGGGEVTSSIDYTGTYALPKRPPIQVQGVMIAKVLGSLQKTPVFTQAI